MELKELKELYQVALQEKPPKYILLHPKIFWLKLLETAIEELKKLGEDIEIRT